VLLTIFNLEIKADYYLWNSFYKVHPVEEVHYSSFLVKINNYFEAPQVLEKIFGGFGIENPLSNLSDIFKDPSSVSQWKRSIIRITPNI
jgi:hypothetical protein